MQCLLSTRIERPQDARRLRIRRYRVRGAVHEARRYSPTWTQWMMLIRSFTSITQSWWTIS
jgi:hypothetical protein